MEIGSALEALALRLGDDYQVVDCGFAQFADLADERQRAVVSDQLLSTTDAIAANGRDARGHARRVVELHGPNGRAMPDPEVPAELEQMHELDRETAGVFRAVGSELDCLAGAAIAVLRVPESIQRADAGALWRLEKLAAQDGAPAAWQATAQTFCGHRGDSGWLEWTIETRNAVVHRARQLHTWLPRGGREPGQQPILVRTDLPVHRLVRFNLHLRRFPWLPDMRALSANRPATEQWVVEPASDTVTAIASRVDDLVEAVCAELLKVWAAAATGDVELAAPADVWALDDPQPAWRVDAARRFEGFGASEVPPLTNIVMSPRDAKRAALAEELRRRAGD